MKLGFSVREMEKESKIWKKKFFDKYAFVERKSKSFLVMLNEMFKSVDLISRVS